MQTDSLIGQENVRSFIALGTGFASSLELQTLVLLKSTLDCELQ